MTERQKKLLEMLKQMFEGLPPPLMKEMEEMELGLFQGTIKEAMRRLGRGLPIMEDQLDADLSAVYPEFRLWLFRHRGN